ncbi:MAG: hypothetical protein LBE92_01205 [Chryseobacterium sp.]|jgi:hypothetical protein|uniref:hypothetical protein n=1 Tax=Chryseobacterium sp. TaxID=1871047 RepID=UPI00283275D2|nr:hypothetical protein [Chryseobacterium sp.]MDR2234716.1 hypothetical protein [Chryseobacterium sp.]
MSCVKHEVIWQHDNVLPYILTTLKNKIDEITEVEKIFLFGSRGRVPFEQRKDLIDKDYDVELLVPDEEKIKMYYSGNKLTMIFSGNELKIPL